MFGDKTFLRKVKIDSELEINTIRSGSKLFFIAILVVAVSFLWFAPFDMMAISEWSKNYVKKFGPEKATLEPQFCKLRQLNVRIFVVAMK